jgi:hypothetical protein
MRLVIRVAIYTAIPAPLCCPGTCPWGAEAYDAPSALVDVPPWTAIASPEWSPLSTNVFIGWRGGVSELTLELTGTGARKREGRPCCPREGLRSTTLPGGRDRPARVPAENTCLLRGPWRRNMTAGAEQTQERLVRGDQRPASNIRMDGLAHGHHRGRYRASQELFCQGGRTRIYVQDRHFRVQHTSGWSPPEEAADQEPDGRLLGCDRGRSVSLSVAVLNR